jgi:hypothetical protein
MSHRTPYHKPITPVLEGTEHFPYASIFLGKRGSSSELPCLEPEAFVRSIDDIFHFIKMPSYYAIAYTGSATPLHQVFGYLARSHNGSVELVGYGSQGYGHKYWIPSKLAGLSAVFVPDCGPTLLSSAQDVSLTNNLWGRLKQPIPVPVADGIDNCIVSGAILVPTSEFDAEQRVLRKSGEILYTPLKWRRTIRFLDDCIEVQVEITADEAVELHELYECLPVMVEKKRVRLYGPSAKEASVCDFSAASDANKAVLAFDIDSETGAGTSFILDRPYAVHIEPWFKGSGTGSINLALPTRFKAGEHVELQYRIQVHAEPITSPLFDYEK